MRTTLLIGLFVLVTGCRKERPGQAPSADGLAAPSPSGPAGRIRGVVELAGAAPAVAAPPRRDSDPYCVNQPWTDESLRVKSGRLAGVFVRIASPVNGSFSAPTEVVVIDQLGCEYRPRVTAAMVGQRVRIGNTDATLHNVHGYLGDEAWFNRPQPAGSAPVELVVEADAPVATLRCDVHPWMVSYLGVAPHPFFAVTGEAGEFELADVPPGTHRIEAWHERAGTRSREVTVPPGGSVEATLTFASSDVRER